MPRQSSFMSCDVLSLVLILAATSVAGELYEFLTPGECDVHSDLSDDILISENLMNSPTTCILACQQNSNCRLFIRSSTLCCQVIKGGCIF